MMNCPTLLRFLTFLLTSPLLLFVFVASAHADGHTGDSGDRLKWPSADFPTLQDAIDAAPDNATIELQEGTFRIDSTLMVRGKRLNFVGAGDGTRRGRITRLIGPEPRPVTDAVGNIILAADEAIGLFQIESDSDVGFSKMNMSGFDAGIVIHHDPRGGRAPNVHVNKVLISHTGRGILSLSASQLIVTNSIIESTLWNGISLAKPPMALLQALNLKAVTIGNPNGAGIYCEDGLIFIAKVTVTNASGGGIVANNCSVSVTDSYILNSHLAGILLSESGGFIAENFVVNTDATFAGILGDGIVLWSSSTAYLEDNVVNHSERAGISVFGGNAQIRDSSFTCATFDLVEEPWNGQPPVLGDLGGVECGCGPDFPRRCITTSSAVAPPPPVGGLE